MERNLIGAKSTRRSREINKQYFLILPNIFLQEPCLIGTLMLQRFNAADKGLGGDENEELLKNIQEMLINNGFSGLFTYSYFNSNDQFQDIVLNVRKIMTIFRYVALEEHRDFSLELLTYYLLHPQKLSDEIPEMKYSFEGIQDGTRHIYFYSPGFREVTRRANYPEIITLDSGHYLIHKFNANDLEDKYIIAMERFNRTFKENHDLVEDILNLTTAFEHLFEKSDGAVSFAKHIIETLRIDGTPLSDTVKKWSEEFYRVRGEILHGNAFKKYDSKRGYDYWEQCFKWRHPTGKIRYIQHAAIANKIFQLVMNRLLGAHVCLKIEQLEFKLTESQIEPLITPNEVYYKELKNLVDSGIDFGESYHNPISKIKRCDGTEEKSVLLELLPYFLNVTKNRFPDLEKECEETMNLVSTKDIVLLGLRVIELSQKIRRKEQDPMVINEETVIDLSLSQFFEKAYSALTHIAWIERSTK